MYKVQKRQHNLYFADHLFFILTKASQGQFLCIFLIDHTIFPRLCLMQLHHLLAHDQQLTDFTVSPVRTTHVDIAALSLL